MKKSRGNRQYCSFNRWIALLLTLCLVISMNGVSVFADSAEPSDGTEEVSDTLPEDQEYSDDGMPSDEDINVSETDTGTESDGDVSSDEDSETVSSSDADSSSEEMDLTEETDPAVKASSEEEEEEFEETGIFGATVTDANGAEVNAWKDSSSGYYYLFLTSAVSIPDLSVEITGIRMEKTSKGTLDPKTNVLTGAFAADGDGVTLTDEGGSKYNLIVRQSGLPSLCLTLNGTTLDTVNSGSKETKYSGNSLILSDASGSLNLAQGDVELKGRGNSTWAWSDKKPYQIKFNKKQSVLGMGKAKKWVLLANSFDDSMIRNQVAFRMAKLIGMEWAPSYENVDLWVDGEYRGTYGLCEKVEIGSNRLNLTSSTGVLMEHDDVFYQSESNYFYDTVSGAYFVLKEAADEDTAGAASQGMEQFHSRLDQFLSYLYNTNSSAITLDGLNRYADIDSVAKWYLVNEYLSNFENYATSWYWYMDGADDVVHMGPVWDFDVGLANCYLYTDYSLLYGKENSALFKKLMSVPAFVNYVKKLYEDNINAIGGLSSYVMSIGSAISASAEMNYIRWPWLGTANQKAYMNAYSSTYSGAVAYLSNWLNGRYANFSIDGSDEPSANCSATVSSSGRNMTIKAENVSSGVSNLRVAVWSAANNQDDLKWYTLKNQGGGTWSVTVDLTKHGSSDTYYAHVYSGSSTCLARLSAEVKMIRSKLTAEYSEETGKITAKLTGADTYKTISIAVWSEKNDQDDLKWYTASVDSDGVGTITVNPKNHNSTGAYQIHAYGSNGTKMYFMASTSVTVNVLKNPVITAEKEDDSNYLDIAVKNVDGYSNLQAAVWGSKNNQNDLKWYSMKQDSDENWNKTVNLASHGETGTYNVHIYATLNGKQKMIGYTTINVDEIFTTKVLVRTVQEGTTVKAVLQNDPGLSSVTFAVWGAENNQNDLKWYTASKESDGSWSAVIPLAEHPEMGTCYVHAYGVKSGKNMFRAAASFEITELNIPTLECKVSTSGKVMRVNLDSPDRYSRVTIAVWSKKNGQDDLKWYSASKNLDGSWSITVDLTSHGDTGLYYIHAYGMKSGKSSCVATDTATVSKMQKPAMTAYAKGTGFVAQLDNSDQYANMKFAVWTDDSGQDDIQWYEGVKYSAGSWRIYIDTRTKGGNGLYHIAAYASVNGKMIHQKDCSYTESQYAAADIETELKGTKLKVTVKDAVVHSSPRIALWGSKDGQNDLKWYFMTKKDDSTYTVTVDLSKHKETGLFYIHAYGNIVNAQYFLGSTEVTLKAAS